ncbi:MAG: hypothetical protein ACP6IY_17085 [Promethearchaeia archaeon]
MNKKEKHNKQKFNKHSHNLFSKIGEIPEYFNKLKEDIANKFKQKKTEMWKKKLKKGELTPEVRAMKKFFKQELKKQKEYYEEIIENLKLEIYKNLEANLNSIIQVLEHIEIKANNIEKITSPLVPMLEKMMENIEHNFDNIEDYLQERLGSDYEKFRKYIKQYKNNEITKKRLIMKGISLFGQKFLKLFLLK